MIISFCDGKKYRGKSFFAVTPDFVYKCEKRLLVKNHFNFDRFDDLQQFQMSPLDKSSLIEMGKIIAKTHGIAYNWDTSKYATDERLSIWLNKYPSIGIGDHTRQSIKLIVSKLDSIFQEQE